MIWPRWPDSHVGHHKRTLGSGASVRRVRRGSARSPASPAGLANMQEREHDIRNQTGGHPMVRAVFALFACIAAVVSGSAATSCEALARLTLPGASIASAVSVPAGNFTPPDNKPIANLPAFCRVTGVISPATDSNIRFEVWMPSAGWNGKFEGVGNGGFAGVINYSDMAAAISH